MEYTNFFGGDDLRPLIWIIDEEWSEYQTEEMILKDAFPDCEIRHSGNNYQEDLESFGKHADAILCQVYINLPGETIRQLTNCKIIAIYGGGYDRVDIEAAKAQNIAVTFVPGYCVEDVSDYAISAIYFFNKNLAFYFSAANKGPWGAQAAHQLNHRIQESTLFIIGFGRIGKTVAQKAKLMRMNVLVYDPNLGEEEEQGYGVKKVSLDEGLSAADFVTIHVKYDEHTESLISMKEFQKMKETAYVINTSRGNVIKEEDLIEAVQKKVIAGAMLDVISNEPPEGHEEIFTIPGIFVTPHVSYLSAESLLTLKQRASSNVVKLLQGKNSEDTVY
ncbi:C-terminal binding protein [Sporolactobacillus shoreae]|uniref:C-terminal binding protein n=1 Tax=Sporolactobacillus shoreae TaxID=1465501 RepID=A0A4Z0GR49_9BACL|nr:C-terminal binding protein [Sporolactobacillus shoreae]